MEKKRYFLIVSIFIVLLIAILISFASFIKLTGKVTFETQPNYAINEFLSGQTTITLQEGDSIQKDTQINLVLLKDGIILAETTKTLEEFLGGQISYVPVTNDSISCVNITTPSEQEVCENITSPETMHEVCHDEETENGTVQVCENVATPGETFVVCTNQTLGTIEENCTTTILTDYYYQTPGSYSVDLRELLDYNLIEPGEYTLILSIPSMNINEESTFSISAPSEEPLPLVENETNLTAPPTNVTNKTIVNMAVQAVSAITANSSSYSVDMIGTSYQSSSTSGNSTEGDSYLTTLAVGNAQSSSYQASVGYFGEYGAQKRTETGFYAVITSTKNITGGQIYSATIEIRNSSSDYINPSSTPKIKLYDPLRNLIVDNVGATQISTGLYQYNFTTSITHTTGLYETLISITVDGNSKQYRDFWRLVNAPTEVSIISITDNTIPTITANVVITNEGNIDYEYVYEYCIVSEESNQCGGGDDVDYDSGSKSINKGQSWNTQLTLNANQQGTYWFKVVVHYNNQMSGASKSFTAVPESITPSGGGGVSGRLTTVDVQGSITVSEQQLTNGIIAQLEINEKVILTINSETHTIAVSNVGTNSITIAIASNPMPLQLEIGEEKEIDINGDGMKDLYFKLNKINNGKADLVIKKLIGRSLITGEAIQKVEHLFDLNVKILEDYLNAYSGSKVLAEITIYNLGTEEMLDAKLHYYIKNAKGEIIASNEETIAVYIKVQVVKELLLPENENVKPGIYYFYVDISYNDKTATGKASFRVVEKPAPVIPFTKMQLIIISLIIILILLLIIILIYKKKKSRKKVKVIPLKKEEVLPEGRGRSIFDIVRDLVSIDRILDIFRVHRKDNLLSTKYGMKVYSSDGMFIGKIREVYLEGHKIYGWLIEVNKEIQKEVGNRHILLKQRGVKAISEVMIIDERISMKLKQALS